MVLPVTLTAIRTRVTSTTLELERLGKRRVAARGTNHSPPEEELPLSPNNLEGRLVVAAIFGADASVHYVRGVVQCKETEALIKGDDGAIYTIPIDVATSAGRVDASVRAAAPKPLAALLLDASYVIRVPPTDGNWALARTPGWKARLKEQ